METSELWTSVVQRTRVVDEAANKLLDCPQFNKHFVSTLQHRLSCQGPPLNWSRKDYEFPLSLEWRNVGDRLWVAKMQEDTMLAEEGVIYATSKESASKSSMDITEFRPISYVRVKNSIFGRTMDDEVIPDGPLYRSTRLQLMPYQVEGIRWMAARGALGVGSILADEMGLGKTMQAIALASFMMGWGENPARPLVIVPKRIVEQIAEDFRRWGAKSMRVTTSEFAEDWPSNEVRIVSYKYPKTEILSWLNEDVRAFGIMDEAHSVFDGQDSETFRWFLSIPLEFSVMMTATPLGNVPNNVFYLLQAANPKIFFDGASTVETLVGALQKRDTTDDEDPNTLIGQDLTFFLERLGIRDTLPPEERAQNWSEKQENLRFVLKTFIIQRWLTVEMIDRAEENFREPMARKKHIKLSYELLDEQQASIDSLLRGYPITIEGKVKKNELIVSTCRYKDAVFKVQQDSNGTEISPDTMKEMFGSTSKESIQLTMKTEEGDKVNIEGTYTSNEGTDTTLQFFLTEVKVSFVEEGKTMPEI